MKSSATGSWLLFVALLATGCVAPPVSRPPAHSTAVGTRAAEAATDTRADDGLASVDAAREAIQAATAAEASAPDDQPPAGWVAPEAVHHARLEIARAALIDANAAKQQIDAAEQLERELETLMDRQRTAKGRGRPHRDVSAK